MSSPRITLEENPDPGLHDEILRPLRAFNESQIGPGSIEPLAICLRGPDEAVIGGLWGRLAHGWLFVDLLVVPEEMRCRGLGTSLMRQAEDVAHRRGCIGIWLHTGTFQAPGFYEKLGYTSFGVLEDYPPGHACIHYSKRLPA